MKSYSSREVIKVIMSDGWYLHKVSGDHYQFLHRLKPGKVTIQHPKKDLRLDNLKSIEKQAGVKFGG
ncbi:MAG: type II toxin-antitoxin system HicA family toxin [Oscillospiraceae bacterium]|jgi:predicted RNA binding protein YcfA (HicA-like mRNA interferase family)|nr:type II toxin-antitoxin system HicA family toxin [Oscillospiraceae bacterium]